jgi:hypothetical protein
MMSIELAFAHGKTPARVDVQFYGLFRGLRAQPARSSVGTALDRIF